MMKMPATVRVLSDRGSPSPSWDLLDDSDSDTRLSLSIPRSDFGDIAPPTGPEVPQKETFGFAIRPTAGSLQREREPLYEPTPWETCSESESARSWVASPKSQSGEHTFVPEPSKAQFNTQNVQYATPKPQPESSGLRPEPLDIPSDPKKSFPSHKKKYNPCHPWDSPPPTPVSQLTTPSDSKKSSPSHKKRYNPCHPWDSPPLSPVSQHLDGSHGRNIATSRWSPWSQCVQSDFQFDGPECVPESRSHVRSQTSTSLPNSKRSQDLSDGKSEPPICLTPLPGLQPGFWRSQSDKQNSGSLSANVDKAAKRDLSDGKSEPPICLTPLPGLQPGFWRSQSDKQNSGSLSANVDTAANQHSSSFGFSEFRPPYDSINPLESSSSQPGKSSTQESCQHSSTTSQSLHGSRFNAAKSLITESASSASAHQSARRYQSRDMISECNVDKPPSANRLVKMKPKLRSRICPFSVTVGDAEQAKSSGMVIYWSYVVTSSHSRIRDGTTESVRREFSDFQWLRRVLEHARPGSIVPLLPKPKFLGRMRSGYLPVRCRELEQFLTRVLDKEHFFNLRAVESFLHSSNEIFELEKQDFVESPGASPRSGGRGVLNRIFSAPVIPENISDMEDSLSRHDLFLTVVGKKSNAIYGCTKDLMLRMQALSTSYGALSSAIRDLDTTLTSSGTRTIAIGNVMHLTGTGANRMSDLTEQAAVSVGDFCKHPMKDLITEIDDVKESLKSQRIAQKYIRDKERKFGGSDQDDIFLDDLRDQMDEVASRTVTEVEEFKATYAAEIGNALANLSEIHRRFAAEMTSMDFDVDSHVKPKVRRPPKRR
eukprot:74682_1